MNADSTLAGDVIAYGRDVATEDELRLLGDVRGKRVLELGCENGQRSIALARQGATAIGIDFSAGMIDAAKRLCERQNAKVELRHGDLADLAFLRADSVDLVLSVDALSYVPDYERVFRQANRVLKPGAPLVFSLPHPTLVVVDDSSADQAAVVARSYFDPSPLTRRRGDDLVEAYHHTTSELLMALFRSGYRVDAVVEPEWAPRGPSERSVHESFAYLPRALVVRARKEGN